MTTLDCIRSGPQAATCYVKASDGTATTINVTISPSGRQYIEGG